MAVDGQRTGAPYGVRPRPDVPLGTVGEYLDERGCEPRPAASPAPTAVSGWSSAVLPVRCEWTMGIRQSSRCPMPSTAWGPAALDGHLRPKARVMVWVMPPPLRCLAVVRMDT